jgi:hypothetical protein
VVGHPRSVVDCPVHEIEEVDVMSRKTPRPFRRDGAYIIKSAETRPTRVPAKTDRALPPAPSGDYKNLIAALRRAKANT